MIVHAGENKPMEIRGNTVDGILFNVWMKSASINTNLNAADFISSNMTIKATLVRNKQPIVICQDNLQVLGVFAALSYGAPDWLFGNRLQNGTGGAYGYYLLSLRIPFGGPINVKGDDLLLLEGIASPGVFSSDCDITASYVEFNPDFAKGYEMGTPQIQTMVVQTNTTNQKFDCGTNVGKIVLINLDKTNINLDQQVVSSVQLASKEISAMWNWYDIFNRHRNNFTSPTVKYQTAADATLTPVYVPYVPLLPQSFVLHAGTKDRPELLNDVAVNLVTNSANVNASQNYVAWNKYTITQELQARAFERARKHDYERLAAMPKS